MSEMDDSLQQYLNAKVNIFVDVGQFRLWFSSSHKMILERSLVGGLVHTHTIYDVHCCIQGSYYITINDQRILLRAGQIAVIAPGVYHNTEQDPACSLPLLRTGFKLGYIKAGAEEYGLDTGFPQEDRAIAQALTGLRGYAIIPDDFGCANFLRQMNRELSDKRPGHYRMLQGIILCITIPLTRHLARYNRSSQGCSSLIQDTRFESIEEYFNNHCGTGCSQEELAAQLHISTLQQNRLLLDLYGVGFKEKLTETRVEVAKNLLVNTRMPLSEIAESCGYGFASSLSHSFKKQTGQTPMDYRRLHRPAIERPATCP